MIPGVETVHPRESWVDPAYPVTGPPSPDADIHIAVIHYTAADDLIDGDPGEHAEDLPAYFRSMQRYYVTHPTRGYSLGYRWGVDWLGGVWQIRGWEFKSAANAGWNNVTEPILVLVDGNDPATDEAVDSVRKIIAESQRRSGRTFAIKGHGQLRAETGVGTATSCPGVGLQAQIGAGVFSPQIVRPPPPPIATTGDTMLYIAVPKFAGKNDATPWLAVFESGQVRRAMNADVRYAEAAGVPFIDQDSAEQHKYMVAKFGI